MEFFSNSLLFAFQPEPCHGGVGEGGGVKGVGAPIANILRMGAKEPV